MSQFKILYAEDDETLAFLTKDNLEQNGYEVHHCSDGALCIKKFQKESFDICIFDIMMPKMDGFELAEAIRKVNSDIPIIFLSAKTLKEDGTNNAMADAMSSKANVGSGFSHLSMLVVRP